MIRDVRPSSGATIAVSCVAIGMLMLDISVVNTALSDISSELGLEWTA